MVIALKIIVMTLLFLVARVVSQPVKIIIARPPFDNLQDTHSSALTVVYFTKISK